MSQFGHNNFLLEQLRENSVFICLIIQIIGLTTWITTTCVNLELWQNDEHFHYFDLTEFSLRGYKLQFMWNIKTLTDLGRHFKDLFITSMCNPFGIQNEAFGLLKYNWLHISIFLIWVFCRVFSEGGPWINFHKTGADRQRVVRRGVQRDWQSHPAGEFLIKYEYTNVND